MCKICEATDKAVAAIPEGATLMTLILTKQTQEEDGISNVLMNFELGDEFFHAGNPLSGVQLLMGCVIDIAKDNKIPHDILTALVSGMLGGADHD